MSKWEPIFIGKCSLKKLQLFVGRRKLSYLVLHTETRPEFGTNMFVEIDVTYYKCTQIAFQDNWKTKLRDQEGSQGGTGGTEHCVHTQCAHIPH